MTDTAIPVRRAGLPALRSVFADRRYRKLFIGTTAAMAAQWMQRIALGWLIWDMTQSGAWLGALAIAELAPGLVLGPLGGVLSDRMDRRRLILCCQSVIFAGSIVTGVVVLAGVASPILLLALAGIGGSAAATQESSRSLLIRDVTPPDCLATGMSLTAIAVNVTRFLGPAIAAPLMQGFGVASVFWINAAVSMVLMAIVASLSDVRSRVSHQSGHFARDLWQGAVAAATHASVTPVLIVFAVTALLVRPLYELMPAFADELFHGDVQDYSFLIMAVGAGAIVGAVVVTLNAPTRPARMFMTSSIGACAALAAFASSTDMIMGMASTAALGFFMCMSATSSQLVVIMDAEERTSGRVLSLWGTIMRGGPALGALALGVALDLLGYRWPLLIAAFLAAMFVGFTVLESRRRARRRAGRAEN